MNPQHFCGVFHLIFCVLYFELFIAFRKLRGLILKGKLRRALGRMSDAHCNTMRKMFLFRCGQQHFFYNQMLYEVVSKQL